MKKLLILSFLLTITIVSFAQQGLPANKCNAERVYTKCEHPPSFGKDSLALQQYFDSTIHAAGINGTVIISFQISSTGAHCGFSIENNTDFLSTAKLKTILAEMQNWNPGTQNGWEVVCYEFINLNFDGTKLIARYGM